MRLPVRVSDVEMERDEAENRGDGSPYRIVDHLPEIKRRRDSYGHFFFELATISIEHIVSYRT